MFKPDINLPLNIKRTKPNNNLITNIKNNSISLLEWIGIDLKNGDSNSLLAQNGTWQEANSFAWTLNGNSGTNSNLNFIGTTDNTDLFIKAKDLQFSITENYLSGNDALNMTTEVGDDFHSIFNDKPVLSQDHFLGLASYHKSTGQGASIFVVHDAGSSEHGIVMNYDTALGTDSARFTINTDGVRFLNQDTLNVFFQVDLNGNLVLPQIGTYANDAAAQAAGIPINGVYRESVTGYLKARVS